MRSELADMGCVLARGCDSCTHESEEVEAADMGCVLARGCDSCTHEPWFCGLKCGDEVGLGDSSNLETRFVNDPSRDLCATVPMKVVLVRAHDWFDDHSEVSVEQLRLNLILSFCDLCFHRSLTTPMLLGGFLTLVHPQVFWLNRTCQPSGQCCRTMRG